jgi:hypothetical protein
MFVPSLSWQNDRFYIYIGSKMPFFAGGALRASGAEFLAQGWFNGGYNHQVNGLGAKFYAAHFRSPNLSSRRPEPNWFERQSLNLGDIAQHW